MYRLITLAFAFLLISCASYSGRGLQPGQSETPDVLRVMGEPAMQWQEPDGSRLLAYPRGPMGVHTYMVKIANNGKLQGIENLLTSGNLRRIEAGMSKEQVLRALGPSQPAWTVYFKARDELVWEWSYCDDFNQLARFDVLFDGTKEVVRSAFSHREECGPTAVCWCAH